MQLREEGKKEALVLFFQTTLLFNPNFIICCRLQNYNHESPEVLHNFINKLHNSQIKHFWAMSVITAERSYLGSKLTPSCRLMNSILDFASRSNGHPAVLRIGVKLRWLITY
jgi:hypothetical protein